MIHLKSRHKRALCKSPRRGSAEKILGIKKKTQLAIFSKELALMLNAGLSIQDALEVLIKSHSSFQEPLNRVQQGLFNGARLSEAMNREADTFGKAYVHTVRLAEETGSLVAVFALLAEWQEREVKLLAKASQAFIYPAFVVFVSLLGALVFGVSCLPLFMEVLTEIGGTLPFVSQLLLTGTRLFLNPLSWFLGFLALGLWAAFLKNWLATDDGLFEFEKLLRSLPYLGILVRDISLARVFVSLNLTTRVGLDMLRALKVSAQASGSAVLMRDFQSLMAAVTEGLNIHQYLESVPQLYPKDVVGLVCVGEEGAGLEKCFKYLSIYYEREVEYRLATFLAILEPLFTGLVSVFVGVVVLALLLPLSSVLEQL